MKEITDKYNKTVSFVSDQAMALNISSIQFQQWLVIYFKVFINSENPFEKLGEHNIFQQMISALN